MDRLDRLRTFIAVGETGSFAAAAKKMRLSAAAVTRAIAALEQDLGASLFRRTTRTVRLTDEGVQYLERCKHLLDEWIDAEQSVRGENGNPRGNLVITAPVCFGRMHILPVIASFLKQYPDVNIRLLLVDRLVRLADEGIDIAVRISDLSDSALHAVRIGHVRRLVVAAPGYIDARGLPRTAVELTGHDIIAFDNQSVHDEWRFGEGPGHTYRFEPKLLVNTADAAIEAALAGIGLTRVISYQVSRQLADGTLVEVPIPSNGAEIPVSLVFQGVRRRSANVRCFLDHARAHFRNSPLEAAAPSSDLDD
jgi:DNA-binding transcriptional LysR family regulator